MIDRLREAVVVSGERFQAAQGVVTLSRSERSRGEQQDRRRAHVFLVASLGLLGLYDRVPRSNGCARFRESATSVSGHFSQPMRR
jgi:hypothetical protein